MLTQSGKLKITMLNEDWWIGVSAFQASGIGYGNRHFPDSQFRHAKQVNRLFGGIGDNKSN